MERGYSVAPGVPRPHTAFFPLTPWLARVPDLVLPTRTAAMLVANVLALLAFIAVWAVAREWKDDGIARITVLLLALWPPSVYLWMFYAEAGFIAASAGRSATHWPSPDRPRGAGRGRRPGSRCAAEWGPPCTARLPWPATSTSSACS